MNCPKCHHPINRHGDGGCWKEKPSGDLCECMLDDGEVALLLLPKLEKRIKQLEKQLADMEEMMVEESR